MRNRQIDPSFWLITSSHSNLLMHVAHPVNRAAGGITDRFRDDARSQNFLVHHFLSAVPPNTNPLAVIPRLRTMSNRPATAPDSSRYRSPQSHCVFRPGQIRYTADSP